MKAVRPDERFMKHVEMVTESGCWLWIGSVDRGGYGTFRIEKSKAVRAHRFSYEWLREPIPDGLTIDHLCRVKCCVNPWHMEPVTLRENILRSDGVSALSARKTHCDYGHPFDDGNTYRGQKGKRYCRACKRRRHSSQHYLQKRRELRARWRTERAQ